MNRHFPNIYIYIHTNGQRVNEKALNITNITGNKIETTVRYRLTRNEMAITKKPKGECCRECGVENTLVHCWCRTLTFAGALPPPGTGDTQGPRHRPSERGARQGLPSISRFHVPLCGHDVGSLALGVSLVTKLKFPMQPFLFLFTLSSPLPNLPLKIP